MNQGSIWQAMRELPLALAIVLCLSVRAALYVFDGFDFETSLNLWQMLDFDWLRTSPVRSIYLMHSQPPLFNAIYAFALALPGASGFAFLHILFVVLSMVAVTAIYLLLRRHGLPAATAGFAAAFFGTLPQVLLYENFYSYAPFEAALLACAMLFAARYLEAGRTGSFAALCVCLVILALLRSLIHIAWVLFVLVAVWGLYSRRHGWDRRSLVVLVASLAIVSSLYFKNLIHFGTFSVSSWDGMTLTNAAAPVLPGDERKFPEIYRDARERAARGEFSPAMSAALGADGVWFGWVDLAMNCEDGMEKRLPLCTVRKMNGEPNFNHISVIGYSRALSGDGPKLLRLYPTLYLHHVAASYMTFVGVPAWDYRNIAQSLKGYTDFANRLLLYDPERILKGPSGGDVWWRPIANRLTSASPPLMAFVIAGMAIVLFRGATDLAGYWRGRRATADWVLPTLVLLLYATVPHLTNAVETQRIRYSIEPILFVAVCVAAFALWRTRRRDRRSGGGPSGNERC